MKYCNRQFAISALTICILLAGCASTTPNSPNSADTTAPSTVSGEVYLLRGLFNVFSLGMDEMGEMLRQQGVEASVHSGPSWPYLGKLINQHRGAGQSQGPLVISGHSYGADDAIRLARILEEHEVEVTALVLVDPTTPPKVPANVKLCVNFYRSSPTTDWMPWLRGVPVETESEDTLVLNRDLRASQNHSALVEEVNHFNIEEHPEIQKMVVDEIINVLQNPALTEEVIEPQQSLNIASKADD